MENIYMTKNIYENLDLRLLTSITALLNNKILKSEKKEMDYLQIFEIKDNKLIHRQEEPEQSEEYILKGKFNDIKIWAVQNIDLDERTYWTVMFPSEY